MIWSAHYLFVEMPQLDPVFVFPFWSRSSRLDTVWSGWGVPVMFALLSFGHLRRGRDERAARNRGQSRVCRKPSVAGLQSGRLRSSRGGGADGGRGGRSWSPAVDTVASRRSGKKASRAKSRKTEDRERGDGSAGSRVCGLLPGRMRVVREA
ncbi:hypothetical protein NL676_033612 [Syzygium grande]|nr:hypothetical protein NL676_033612 [Syzygium grande]